MSSGKRNRIPPSDLQEPVNFSTFLTYCGIIFVAVSLMIAITTFWPVILEELGYNIKHTVPLLQPRNVIPVDRKFGIVIPKIGANASVIPNVNPYNSREYQAALTHGVAHARGTTKPGEAGNVFLFSHSSVNFYEASRYNSVFYLLSKLEKGDTITLYYKDTPYTYTVTSTKTVSSNAVEYLTKADTAKQTLTLMTCWPPGTTYRRLLVIAERL